MRILVVSSTFLPPANGQAVFTGNLIEQLGLAGHEVMAIVPSDKGSAYWVRQGSIDYRFLSAIDLARIYPGAVYTPLARNAVEQAVSYFKPEIIHIQDHYPLCHHAINAGRRRGVKLVGTNHFMPQNVIPVMPWVSVFRHHAVNLLWDWMMLLYNRLDIATAPSRTAVDILKQRIHVPTYPVTCGVSLERFAPIPAIDRRVWRELYGVAQEKTTFFFIGRVVREKRLELILHALKKLSRPDIQFVIAGTGADLNHLKNLTVSLGLEENVCFTGYVPNEHLPLLLNSIDIFVMPSEAELLSIASLEAMATARPVLLANSQALPELVTEGENGYLFKPGDVEDLARCMALLADSPQRWEEMGKHSLCRAQNHSLQKMREGYEAIYRQALEG